MDNLDLEKAREFHGKIRAMVGTRPTGMRYHGRDIMVRVDKYGLEIWPKGTRDKRRVSWRQIVLNQFPQAVS